MMALWVLGYTHVLGGPYLFFKVIFWLAIIPYVVTLFLLFVVFSKVKTMTDTAHTVGNAGSWIYTKVKRYGGNASAPNSQSTETLHVEATIKE